MKEKEQVKKYVSLRREIFMELQTIIKPGKQAFSLDYTTRMMLVGSCFVENIGEKLKYFRYPVEINPCGIVYNPLSVAHTLELLTERKHFTGADLMQHDGKWLSLSHHGSFSDVRAEECLRRINERLEKAAAFLKEARVLVLTWGTAWVYHYRKDGRVVANCHKLPAAEFTRRRLDPDEITEVYTRLLEQLFEYCPGLKVLLTVSPIRHWKDGAHGNQLSKAVLLLATEQLTEKFSQVSYFPSYEIVMDELRDYRFYAEDMLHISPQGIAYIWEKFRDWYITDGALARMKQVDKWNRVLQHRPADPESEAARKLRFQAEQQLRQMGFEL